MLHLCLGEAASGLMEQVDGGRYNPLCIIFTSSHLGNYKKLVGGGGGCQLIKINTIKKAEVNDMVSQAYIITKYSASGTHIALQCTVGSPDPSQLDGQPYKQRELRHLLAER